MSGAVGDGGGAITLGVGSVSLAVRVDSRSGADTGGGTTAELTTWTGVRGISLPDKDGEGGTMVVLTVGAERWVRLDKSVFAGATTVVLSAGAARPCWRAMVGAGAINAGSRVNV